MRVFSVIGPDCGVNKQMHFKFSENYGGYKSCEQCFILIELPL